MTMGEMLALFVMTTLLSSVSAVDIDPSVLEYLTKNNYLNESYPITQEAYAGSIKKVQRDFGLKVSGELNAETKVLISELHCDGVKDTIFNATSRRSFRKWREDSPVLTYVFVNQPALAAARTFYKPEMRIAFKMWSDVANINFKESNNESSKIIIDFRPLPFKTRIGREPAGIARSDWNSRTGHHALITFNDNEMWTNHSYAGRHYHFRKVAAHEIGHAIGLVHSPARPSVMNKTCGRYIENFSLSQADIASAVALYGPRIGSSHPTTPNPTNTPPPPPSCTWSWAWACKFSKFIKKCISLI